MQKLLANKTISLTELRNPKKLIESAGDSVVAILNRNKVVGYFVPESAKNKHEFIYASEDKVAQAAREIKDSHGHVIEYLKDK